MHEGGGGGGGGLGWALEVERLAWYWFLCVYVVFGPLYDVMTFLYSFWV